MMYEVELIQEALSRMEPPVGDIDADDVLRLEAEQIVNLLHRRGFRLTTDRELSFDD